MTLLNTKDCYGSVAKFFHWAIFLLLITMLFVGFTMGDAPKEYKPFIYNTHKLTGLTILCLMILRALWALFNTKPTLPPDTKPWEKSAERAVHFMLYLTVMAMPLVGWIGSDSAGHPPHLGDVKLDLPVTQSETLATASFSVHAVLAYAIITLLCIHVGAALFHYIFKRDNVLQRMLPGE